MFHAENISLFQTVRFSEPFYVCLNSSCPLFLILVHVDVANKTAHHSSTVALSAPRVTLPFCSLFFRGLILQASRSERLSH